MVPANIITIINKGPILPCVKHIFVLTWLQVRQFIDHATETKYHHKG